MRNAEGGVHLGLKIIAAVGLGCALALAARGEPPTPKPPPDVAAIVARTPDADGVFRAQDDGTALHIQSGLICPAILGEARMWQLASYTTALGPGTDVGCDYGISGTQDLWLAKLTIFAVKAVPGETVEKAFARYRAEVLGANPGAELIGPALEMKGEVPENMKSFLSEQYQVSVDGLTYVTDLVVDLQSGWIIEIRGTVRTSVEPSEQASALGSLAANSFLGFDQAKSTIGQSR